MNLVYMTCYVTLLLVKYDRCVLSSQKEQTNRHLYNSFSKKLTYFK